MRSRISLACLGALLIVWPALRAQAQGYEVSDMALLGDTAPGTGGGNYAPSLDGNPSLVVIDRAAFSAPVNGGTTAQGIFMVLGGIHTAVSVVGDSAPGTGGGTYSATSSGPSVNISGDVAFRASVTGGTSGSGIFVDSGGTDSAVALVGDTAPGTSGGTYSIVFAHSMNGAGKVAWLAVIAGGSAGEGIFAESGGPDQAIALVGDTAPGTGGGTYSAFGNGTSTNSSGHVAFRSGVSGGTTSGGIFVDKAGVHEAIALKGETAPRTGGGTYSIFGGGQSPNFLSDSGDVVFKANISGGSTTGGIFVASGGVDRAVAVNGDPAPGTGGGTFSGFDQGPAINVFGDVAFRAGVTGGTTTVGYFVEWLGTIRSVVVLGDVAPGTGGATFSSFSGGSLGFNNRGDVALRADLTGGSVVQGLFLATNTLTRPTIPVLSVWGTLLLGSGLLALAAARRRAL